MVKLRHKGLLVLGMTRVEVDRLREGAPIDVQLGDLHASLKGQRILIIPGEDNQSLQRVMEQAATAYENGATSPIEIVKSLPSMKRAN